MKAVGLPGEGWPRFDGILALGDDELAGAADDFGHLVRRRPAAVLRAGSVDDVVRLVRHAPQAGLQLVPRGAGHTTYGHRALGGTIYPISAVPLDAADWRRQLGPDWGRLATAKRRFDPGRALSPGTGVFGDGVSA
jgi:FAD/FMN-containing dehydrogenase